MSKNLPLTFTISSAFEYYDFIIYGLMSGYLGPIFFPSNDLFISQIKAFSVFALGYIARPIGSIIISFWGDLNSRKKVFINTNLILAISTTCISFLPSYAQINFLAPILLVLLRITQAFAFSAELPGAMAILNDAHAKPRQAFSFVISGAAIGSIIATIGVYLLEHYFSQEEILNYAWRIPFLLSIVFCGFSYSLRRNLPDILQEKFINKSDLALAITNNFKEMVSAILIFALPSYLVMMNLFFPSFLKRFYGFSSENIYLLMTLSLVWSVFFAPLFIFFSKNFNQFSVFRIVGFLAIIFFIVFHILLKQQNFNLALLGFFLYQSIISASLTLAFPLVSNFFSKKASLTFVAIPYNLAYTLTSIFSVIITNFTNKIDSALPIWLLAIFIAIFSLANIEKIEQ